MTGFRDILVVELLGGLGDLVMVLPVVHALARRHPAAMLRVLTHAPGDALVRHDPHVAEVRRARKGEERAAVAAELDRRLPDLVVSTTRFGGIPDEIASRGVRSVTDLWRRPPPDEPISHRYLRILADEGLIDAADTDVRPEIRLTPAEHARGAQVLAGETGGAWPVVLVPDAGMAVKLWPHWDGLARELAARGVPVLTVAEGRPLPRADAGVRPSPRADPQGSAAPPVSGARPVPPTDLRGLAALFAAVGRRGGVVVGGDTGPLRMAAAVGARTVALFGPTAAARYGLGRYGSGYHAQLPAAIDLQGLPGCPHRRPTSIAEQVCWWEAACPLSAEGPACMADIPVAAVLDAVLAGRGT